MKELTEAELDHAISIRMLEMGAPITLTPYDWMMSLTEDQRAVIIAEIYEEV